MGLYGKANRTLRKFTADAQKIEQRRRAELEKIDRKMYSSDYIEREEHRINAAAKDRRAQLVNETKTALQADLDEMRQNVRNRLTKAPSVDQVNLLAAIRGLNDLSHDEIVLYADVLKDCPIALRQLKQIGEPLHFMINAPSPADLMSCVDRLESLYASYLRAYTGDASFIASPLVKEMEQYFSFDDSSISSTPFKDTATADRSFWDKNIASPAFRETPDLLDPTDESAAPVVEYYFHSVSDMVNYISEQKAKHPDKDGDKLEAMILADSPDHYGSALRYYRATGEELPLNSTYDTDTE